MAFFESVRTHYDRLAQAYDNRWPAYNKAQADWIAQNLPLSAITSVLDLGCGTGIMLGKIFDQNKQVALTGVDASKEMLKFAATRLPQAQFIEGNIEDENLATRLKAADIVISTSVLHHLHDADGHLRLLYTLTKSGGTIYLSDFANDVLKMKMADVFFRLTQAFHKRSWSSHALKIKIKENMPQAKIVSGTILRPDDFWRIQIYAIKKD